MAPRRFLKHKGTGVSARRQVSALFPRAQAGPRKTDQAPDDGSSSKPCSELVEAGNLLAHPQELEEDTSTSISYSFPLEGKAQSRDMQANRSHGDSCGPAVPRGRAGSPQGCDARRTVVCRRPEDGLDPPRGLVSSYPCIHSTGRELQTSCCTWERAV